MTPAHPGADGGPRPAAAVRPGAGPVALDGPPGSAGVLLLHGLTGSPAAWRPIARDLAAAGLTVRVPLLPGHGTRWQDANRTTWHDWYAAADTAFRQLLARGGPVVVGGLSMGGALALRLAEQRGAAVAGLVLVNPAIASADPRLRALPLLRRLTPSLAAIGNDIAAGGDEVAYDRTPLHALASCVRLWDVVQADLTRVRAPLLVFRSAVDHVVDDSGTALLRRWARPAGAESVRLSRGYHVATLDHDAAVITDRTEAFVRRVTGPGPGGAGRPSPTTSGQRPPGPATPPTGRTA